MDILFIGKRFYTNRDAYTEKFGRIYQLPYHWSKEKQTHLWLIDYHSKEKAITQDENLQIITTPIFSLSFLSFFFEVIFKRPKTIIASGDCYIGLLSFILAKITNTKFIFDVYDKYDTFSGYRNIFGINIYQFLLKNSDICLFASKKLLHDSTSQCKKTILAPNGIDENHFYPRNMTESRKKLNLAEDNLYIGYFGSMEVERGVDDLIEAVKLVRNDGIDLKILLGGKKRNDLKFDDNLFVTYLGNISFNQVPLAMACCNLLALPYRNSEFLDNASSCKIAEYIAMKIPIISTNNPNFLENFAMHINKDNTFSECGEPSSLKQNILKQLKNPSYFNSSENNKWKNISEKIYLRLFSY